MVLNRYIVAALIISAALPQELGAQGQSGSGDPTAWLECLNQVSKKYPDITSPERESGNAECSAQFGDGVEKSRLSYPTPDAAEYKAMKDAAEIHLKRAFFDPQSAIFEWPHGFFYGEWKPFLAKRKTGYVTCGYVNAKNRLGGYVGRRAFVVVMLQRRVIYSDIDGEKLNVVERTCNGRSLALPPPPVEPSAASGQQTNPTDVAQSLTQLASLLERGLISREEFDAEKEKLLNDND